jgi:methylenetetrahydrofolate dehydrogenase (NADP+) / methenyltetrahydrofolate cyclohydrolase
MAKILAGKQIANEIKHELSEVISAYQKQGVTFRLSVVNVGDDAASASYVRGKQKTAELLGIDGGIIHLPTHTTEAELLAVVDGLNTDPQVDGILVQLPLPAHIDSQKVLLSILPDKDVDGFHPLNVGLNVTGGDGIWPCTPSGIMEMLRRSDISVDGKHAVVVGRSNIVGKPMAMLLLSADATVTMCHSRTTDLGHWTRQADILISAVGQAGLIQADMVKPGAVVVDVGMNRVDGKLVGDVDYESVAQVAAAITPVPGGVGPLTVALLMQNTVTLGRRRRGV